MASKLPLYPLNCFSTIFSSHQLRNQNISESNGYRKKTDCVDFGILGNRLTERFMENIVAGNGAQS